MQQAAKRRPSPRPGSTPFRHWGAALAVSGALVLTPLTALADDHDPRESAHPLEVIGMILYPVGWLVDTVVVRPLHWLVHHEPLATVTGHEPDSDPSGE